MCKCSYCARATFLEISSVLSFGVLFFIAFMLRYKTGEIISEKGFGEVSDQLIVMGRWLLAIAIVLGILLVFAIIASRTRKRCTISILGIIFVLACLIHVTLTLCTCIGKDTAKDFIKQIWKQFNQDTKDEIGYFFSCSGFDEEINGTKDCSEYIDSFYNSDFKNVVYTFAVCAFLSFVSLIVCFVFGCQRLSEFQRDMYEGYIPDEQPRPVAARRNNPVSDEPLVDNVDSNHYYNDYDSGVTMANVNSKTRGPYEAVPGFESSF